MKKITIKDVAKEAGVSTTLVSRVMNAPLDENGEPVCAVNRITARRIMNVVVKLGYRPNSAAASLRKKRNNRIGVILPDISHHFFASMARHFENIARKSGYTVLFGSSEDEPQRIETLAMTFIQDNVDGIILIPGDGCRRVVEKIIQQRVPLVLSVRDVPGVSGVGRVLTDNRMATSMALSHLVGKGFRKIEMLSTSRRNSNVEEREVLFCEYMKDTGHQPHIMHCDDKNSSDSISYIIEDAARRGVDALYCPSASLPVSCVQACRDKGIDIPARLAVMGYDGGETFSIVSPTITQISFPKEEVAAESFKILKALIESPTSDNITSTVGPTLLEGGSTDRQKRSDIVTSPQEQFTKVMEEIQKLRQYLD